jgi:hypothetical protein
MIVEAVDFLDRVEAVEFVLSRAHNPIWTVRRHGELIAATICSCAVRDLPLRMMAGAVREDFQGMRVARSFVTHIRDSAPVVGAAVRIDRQDRRDRLTRWGFDHWYEGATGDIVVGFSRPIEPPAGLIFAVPIATDQEIAAGLARLKTSNMRERKPATIPPRSSLTR